MYINEDLYPGTLEVHGRQLDDLCAARRDGKQAFFNYRTLVVRELGGGTGGDEGRRQHLGHHSSTSTSPTHRPSRTPPISPSPSHLTQPSAHKTPLPAHLTPTTAPFRLPPITPPRLSQRTPRSPLTLPVAREWAGVASGDQERSCDVEQQDQANTNTRGSEEEVWL
ncbi:hypothetical protein Pcinc_042546 [Petrolisthes cinctipes]|uniref:Uncharacterized protein n=1 Tax=Petrolisthes cinctipes TaxID=88211 RepID=A0AAE1BKZ3_PETCI|nr:hypothetical protein Pcinc_042546 [Petrolisthes cinctipes]